MIPQEHFRVLAALAEVVDAGVPVWFVGGNHDAWGGSFLRERVGVRVVDGPLEMELAGRRTLVAHGDGVGAGDLGYRLLKAVIRNRVTVRAFRALHPDWGSWVAGRVSSTEHKAEFSDARAAGRASYIRAWALEQLERDPGLYAGAGGALARAGAGGDGAGPLLRQLGRLGAPPQLRGAARGGRAAAASGVGLSNSPAQTPSTPTASPHSRSTTGRTTSAEPVVSRWMPPSPPSAAASALPQHPLHLPRHRRPAVQHAHAGAHRRLDLGAEERVMGAAEHHRVHAGLAQRAQQRLQGGAHRGAFRLPRLHQLHQAGAGLRDHLTSRA